MLSVNLDNKLKLYDDLYNVCLKANRKLSALSRIKKYLDFNKMGILSRAFLNYCPVTLMFYNKINHLQERTLRTAFDDYELISEELLEKDGSITTQDYNIQTLCLELYKLSETCHELFSVSG